MDTLIQKLEEFLNTPVMSLSDDVGGVFINGHRHNLSDFPLELQSDLFLELGMVA